MVENKDNRFDIAVLISKMAKNKWFAAVQAVIIALCTWALWCSDAYFMPYLLVSIAALVSLFFNLWNSHCYTKFEIIITFVFSLLYSLMITMANYGLWDVGGLLGVVKFVLILFGSFIAFANILYFIARKKSNGYSDASNYNDYRKLFWFTFILIFVINCTILFSCKYPGFLTIDSVIQIKQTLDGGYTNSHPFYHTMIIKLFMTIGMVLWGNINAAVAVFMVFQICFMAFSFSFTVRTMREVGAPNWSVIMLIAFFALMPYHIVYSFTMWKDVMFGGAVLLYTLFLYRILKSVGNDIINVIGLVVSGLCFCLLRNNGLIAFVGTAFLFLIVYRLQHKKLVVIMATIIVAGFILKHPVLKALNVAQPDLMESLSIPIQQVALDIIENDDFSEEESGLLGQVMDVKRVPDTYLSYISDPMKDLIRESQNQQTILEHKSDYLGLYLSRIVKHPWTYVRAWIEQTKGYWNSGYSYWVWCLYADGADIGIYSTVHSGVMNKMVNSYLSHFLKFQVCRPLISIGLFAWCVLLFLYIAVIWKDKVLASMTIPSLMVVGSLLVATPVFSDFAYAYFLFCTMPVIGIMAFIGNMNQNKKTNG